VGQLVSNNAGSVLGVFEAKIARIFYGRLDDGLRWFIVCAAVHLFIVAPVRQRAALYPFALMIRTFRQREPHLRNYAGAIR
jgi:hypothetical protein